jgi:hypothetical protein
MEAAQMPPLSFCDWGGRHMDANVSAPKIGEEAAKAEVELLKLRLRLRVEAF